MELTHVLDVSTATTVLGRPRDLLTLLHAFALLTIMEIQGPATVDALLALMGV